jgi:hypothetical protein
MIDSTINFRLYRAEQWLMEHSVDDYVRGCEEAMQKVIAMGYADQIQPQNGGYSGKLFLYYLSALDA